MLKIKLTARRGKRRKLRIKIENQGLGLVTHSDARAFCGEGVPGTAEIRGTGARATPEAALGGERPRAPTQAEGSLSGDGAGNPAASRTPDVGGERGMTAIAGSLPSKKGIEFEYQQTATMRTRGPELESILVGSPGAMGWSPGRTRGRMLRIVHSTGDSAMSLPPEGRCGGGGSPRGPQIAAG